jgi:hypothetical protein
MPGRLPQQQAGGVPRPSWLCASDPSPTTFPDQRPAPCHCNSPLVRVPICLPTLLSLSPCWRSCASHPAFRGLRSNHEAPHSASTTLEWPRVRGALSCAPNPTVSPATRGPSAFRIRLKAEASLRKFHGSVSVLFAGVGLLCPQPLTGLRGPPPLCHDSLPVAAHAPCSASPTSAAGFSRVKPRDRGGLGGAHSKAPSPCDFLGSRAQGICARATSTRVPVHVLTSLSVLCLFGWGVATLIRSQRASQPGATATVAHPLDCVNALPFA